MTLVRTTWKNMKNQCQKRKNWINIKKEKTWTLMQRAKQSTRQNSETIFWTLLGWSPEMPALVSVISHYGGSVQARAIPMQNWRAGASWPRVHDSGRIEAIADTGDVTRESYSGHSELYSGMSGSTLSYVCMCVRILSQAFCPFIYSLEPEDYCRTLRTWTLEFNPTGVRTGRCKQLHRCAEPG